MTKSLNLLLALVIFSATSAVGQNEPMNNDPSNSKTVQMKTYLIEREIPDAGKLNGEQLKGISQKSCSVLKELGTGIQWIHSYVTGNKIYCIYKAESEELIREHAKKGGFPANKIIEIASVISPATAGTSTPLSHRP